MKQEKMYINTVLLTVNRLKQLKFVHNTTEREIKLIEGYNKPNDKRWNNEIHKQYLLKVILEECLYICLVLYVFFV